MHAEIKSARPRTIVLLALALAWGVTLSLACGGSVERSVERSSVGTDRARLASYLYHAGNEETVPSPTIQHEVVRDEATLLSTTGEETCFSVVVRTDAAFDEPLDALSPTCTIGEASYEAFVSDEVTTEHEYTYMAQTERVRVEGSEGGEPFQVSVNEPTQQLLRVIERRGQICCPRGTERAGVVELVLSNDRMWPPVAVPQTFRWLLGS